MSITPRGKDTYLVRVYVETNPVTGKRVEVNRTVHGSFTSAKKVEAKLKSDKESGRLVKTPQMTLNTLLDSYLNSVRHVRAESTQEKDRSYFHYYVRPYIGHMQLKKIDSDTIQNLFDLLLDIEAGEGTTKKRRGRPRGKGLAPVTVKNVKKVLSAAFNYAVRQKLIAENPVRRTRIPRVKKNADSLTTKEAIALDSVKDEFWYGYAFVFQLHTGLRPQELMALVWEDVDFERGTLRVERACKWIRGVFTGFGPPKNGLVRVIGLAPEHLDLLRTHFKRQQKHIEGREIKGESYGEPKIKEWILKEHPKQSHLYGSARLIFPKPDGKVPNHAVPRGDIKKMLERAGVQGGPTNYRWYDLRHTHATHLVALGEPTNHVARRMGHSVSMLMSTYAHVLEERQSVAPTLFVTHIPIKLEDAGPSTEKEAGKGVVSECGAQIGAQLLLQFPD